MDILVSKSNNLSTIGYKKPLSDSKFLSKSSGNDEDLEDDKYEKKYDKILKHVRLSNDPRERDNNENFYAHKIKELAKQKKVTPKYIKH